MSNLPPMPSDGQKYNITGFQAPEAPKKGESLANAIFNTFLQLINQFSSKLQNNAQQLQLVQKITADIDSVMSLFNQITSSSSLPSNMSTQMTAQMSKLSTDVGNIGGSSGASSVKGQLLAQIATINSLMTSQTFLSACQTIDSALGNLKTDLAYLFGNQTPYPGGSALAASFHTDFLNFQGALSTLQKFSSAFAATGVTVPSELTDVINDSDNVYNDIFSGGQFNVSPTAEPGVFTFASMFSNYPNAV